jgi:hypothetical protein
MELDGEMASRGRPLNGGTKLVHSLVLGDEFTISFSWVLRSLFANLFFKFRSGCFRRRTL